jgi:hypothetical protein
MTGSPPFDPMESAALFILKLPDHSLPRLRPIMANA